MLLAHVLAGAAGVPFVGSWSMPVAMPNDGSMLSRALYLQAVYLDAAAVGGVSMTAGTRLVVGG